MSHARGRHGADKRRRNMRDIRYSKALSQEHAYRYLCSCCYHPRCCFSDECSAALRETRASATELSYGGGRCCMLGWWASTAEAGGSDLSLPLGGRNCCLRGWRSSTTEERGSDSPLSLGGRDRHLRGRWSPATQVRGYALSTSIKGARKFGLFGWFSVTVMMCDVGGRRTRPW